MRPEPSAEYEFGQDGGLADADVLRRGEQGEHRLPVRELAQVPDTLENCRNDKVRPQSTVSCQTDALLGSVRDKGASPDRRGSRIRAEYGGLPVRNIAKSTGM